MVGRGRLIRGSATAARGKGRGSRSRGFSEMLTFTSTRVVVPASVLLLRRREPPQQESPLTRRAPPRPRERAPSRRESPASAHHKNMHKQKPILLSHTLQYIPTTEELTEEHTPGQVLVSTPPPLASHAKRTLPSNRSQYENTCTGGCSCLGTQGSGFSCQFCLYIPPQHACQ